MLLQGSLQQVRDDDEPSRFFPAKRPKIASRRRGRWFCNVADKAALRILLQRKAPSCKDFQLFVTL